MRISDWSSDVCSSDLDLGLVAGFHQRLPAGLHQLGGAAAEHRLFAEQVGFGLLLEGGADGVLASTTEAGAIGQRKLLGPAGVVLVYAIHGGHAPAELVFSEPQRTRNLRAPPDTT